MQTHESKSLSPPNYAIFLSGGGARAAYQVGALKALMEIVNPDKKDVFNNPFAVISGTSAGAINAAAYASRAENPMASVAWLENWWSTLSTQSIYVSDVVGVFGNGLKWLLLLVFGWMNPWRQSHIPRSLFNNLPLYGLLKKSIHFDAFYKNLDAGVFDAFAVSATSYSNGKHYTFFQTKNDTQGWKGWQREGIAEKISTKHLMASSAIPFLFSAQPLTINKRIHWCGDGSMRQHNPLSPSIHLGADKILVISPHFGKHAPQEHYGNDAYPSLAQVGGQALADVFIDGLSMDLERVDRINDILKNMSKEQQKQQKFKKIETFVLNPSKNIDEIALRHLHSLPRTVRVFLKVLGVSDKDNSGALLASYMIFESSFARELIELGYGDTLGRSEEIRHFMEIQE